MDGTLYVVAVPIGNLEDITVRAQRSLGEVDLVACEDTDGLQPSSCSRSSGRPRQFVRSQRSPADSTDPRCDEEWFQCGLSSDVGTPTISDPGYRLVSAAIAEDLPVVRSPVPAVTTALCAAGLPTNHSRFMVCTGQRWSPDAFSRGDFCAGDAHLLCRTTSPRTLRRRPWSNLVLTVPL